MRDISFFFPPFEERTSCTNSQKLEVVVQLNPGLHDALRCDSALLHKTRACSGLRPVLHITEAQPQPGSGKAGQALASEHISRALLAVVHVLHLAFGKGEEGGGVCGLQAPTCLLQMQGMAEVPRGRRCSSCSVQFGDFSSQGRPPALWLLARGRGWTASLLGTCCSTLPFHRPCQPTAVSLEGVEEHRCVALVDTVSVG